MTTSHKESAGVHDQGGGVSINRQRAIPATQGKLNKQTPDVSPREAFTAKSPGQFFWGKRDEYVARFDS